jgi:hypothetical protein
MKIIKVNKTNYKEKIEKYSIYIFIIGFFSFCSIYIKDFGVTLDDEIYYLNGLNTYEYVKNLFLSILNKDINIDIYKNKLKEWPIIFEFFLVFLSDIIGIKNIDKVYLLSHQLNFILFCSALTIFYKLIQKRFDNFYLSFLSILLIILSPRIFGESFYNSRDIFFMSLFIFYSYSAYIFLQKKNYRNVIIFSILTALLINTKILGIIPIALFILIYIYNFLNTLKKFVNEKNIIIFFILTTLIFIYSLWPYLWANPIINLYLAFKNILVLHENLIVVNYYFGNYIHSDMMPWHYRTVWFLITTPIIILLLFIIGMISQSFRTFDTLKKSLNKNYNFDKNIFFDLFFFLTFIVTLFLVIELNSSKFGGWRHLYFLYPIVIYFSIYCIKFLKNKFTNKLSIIIFFFLLTINMTFNFFWILKNHPNQYLYFNLLNKKYFMKNFDLDWWGVTHKTIIDYILKNDGGDKIHVYAKGFTNLRDTYLYLNEENKSRIILSNFNDAKYIIDNKMKRIRPYNYNYNNEFSKYYILKVDGEVITEVYIKNK